MDCAIYARVSSAAQRDAHTIESQLQALHAFVTAQGWNLVEKYIDDGHSAKTGMLEHRDGFARMMRDAEARRFEILVIVDVNRLTRTGSIEERATILGPFQRLGIQIATPSGGILDLRSFLGEFWVTIQALVAAEENRKRTESIVRGKQRAIAEGRKPSGPTPYGLAYSRATGTWSIDPVSGRIVVEIFERVAGGESCRAIADDLHDRGIPRPRGSWLYSRVHQIVRSRHTVGEWTVDKRLGLVINVPTLVTEALFQRAQRALMKHRLRGLRKTKYTYLLEGLARCGECGAAMLIRSATKSRTRNNYINPPAYVCRNRKIAVRGVKRCTAAIIRTSVADDRVWTKLSELITNPKLIEDAIAQRRAEADAGDWEADAAGYRRRLGRLDRAESAILARFRRGAVSEGGLDTELDAINRDRAVLRAQLETAETAVDAAASAQLRLNDAKATLDRLRPALPNASQNARRELVERFVRPGSATFRKDEILLLADVPVTRVESRAVADVRLAPVSAADSNQQHESHLRIRLVA